MKDKDYNGVMTCRECGKEIFPDDMIYNMEEVLKEGTYIIHEDCLCTSIKENGEEVIDYLVSDSSMLQDIFDTLLCRKQAIEYLEALGEDDDWDKE